MSGRYHDPLELVAELDELQAALVADGLGRVAWGEVQDLRWQVETFGFHLAALEVRQHSEVHARRPGAIRRGADGDPPGRPGCAGRPRSSTTFRAMAAIQARFGAARCRPLRHQLHAAADDVLDVLELAGRPIRRPAGDRRLPGCPSGRRPAVRVGRCPGGRRRDRRRAAGRPGATGHISRAAATARR